MSNSTGNPDPTPPTVTVPPPAPSTPAPATNEPPPPSDPVVVTVVSSSQGSTTTVITSTASPPHTSARSISKQPSSTSSTPSPARTNVPSSTPVTSSSGGSGGLTGTTRVVVAVVVPIIGVACIAILLLFFWKRRQQKKADEEKHRKEIEEYGYNPNQDPHVLATARADNEDSRYELAEGEGAGYRGWGSTNGGRRPTNVAPGVGMGQPLSPVGMAFPEGNYTRPAEGPDGYVGVATSPSASTFPTGHPPSTDGNSNAPLISGRSNPPGTTTTDSSVVGTIKGPSHTDDPEGVHRGVSNASSNYSAVTRSTQSDMAQPLSHHDAQYYGADTMYEDRFYYSGHPPPHAYSADNPYGPSSPPIIRDVEARRHTRIETPTNTHFPQQGNSGIAQNF